VSKQLITITRPSKRIVIRETLKAVANSPIPQAEQVEKVLNPPKPQPKKRGRPPKAKQQQQQQEVQQNDIKVVQQQAAIDEVDKSPRYLLRSKKK
jgi:NACalpha-BTF3-like transcription factor